jgi:hypothetical protein
MGTQRLIQREYGILLTGFGMAFIGALLAGKVVLIADLRLLRHARTGLSHRQGTSHPYVYWWFRVIEKTLLEAPHKPAFSRSFIFTRLRCFRMFTP